MLKRIAVLLLILLVTAGCNLPRPAAGPEAQASLAPATASTAVAASESPAPVEAPPTATAPPARLLLLALPGSDADLAAALAPVLQELAQANGLIFETRDDLPTLNLQDEARYVVALPPDPGVANLAQANPKTQFMLVGASDAPARDNLSVAAGGAQAVDQAAFVAGYLAAEITDNWRVGVLSYSDTPAGLAARNGFTNGAVFYCGLCRPAVPPFVQYPVFAEVAQAAAPEDLQAAAAALLANGVQTVYVFPGITDAALFETLAQKGVRLIGGAAPPPNVGGQWVASIRSDEIAAVRAIFARWLEGEGGVQLAAPLAVTDVNPALLSPGRQRLVDELIAEMLAGGIDTGVDPTTGELK